MIIDEKKLQQIMDEATESGAECGCQLAIYKNGKLELSLWSGYTSAERNIKVSEETLFPIYSCGKGIVATCVHQLIERGILDYSARIADYWKEFGCSGKEDIRLWQVLSHRTGLHNLPELESFAQMGDWELMCRKMEESTPLWMPGTKCGYQGVTFAWLLGEPVRRAAGKFMRDIILENIFEPLHIQDSFYFGTDDEIDRRTAKVDTSIKPDSWCGKFTACPQCRHGFIPSANGFANALALGKVYSAIVAETDGVRLLKPETLENTTKLCRWDKDEDPFTTWARFGLGYALPGDKTTIHKWFGHGGALGGEGFADKEEHWSLAFTKNKDLPEHPDHPVRRSISQALGIPERIW